MVVVYPLCQDFSRKCPVFKFKIEEYLQSRYSLGANTISTGTKGVQGNNIPSVLTFSSQNTSRDNCITQSIYLS